MIYHTIRTIKVWHGPIDRLPEIYFGMSFLFLLLAGLCGIHLIRRWRSR